MPKAAHAQQVDSAIDGCWGSSSSSGLGRLVKVVKLVVELAALGVAPGPLAAAAATPVIHGDGARRRVPVDLRHLRTVKRDVSHSALAGRSREACPGPRLRTGVLRDSFFFTVKVWRFYLWCVYVTLIMSID